MPFLTGGRGRLLRSGGRRSAGGSESVQLEHLSHVGRALRPFRRLRLVCLSGAEGKQSYERRRDSRDKNDMRELVFVPLKYFVSAKERKILNTSTCSQRS